MDNGFFLDETWEQEEAPFHSTVLSDCVWKKFELIESPPLSPRRDDDSFALSHPLSLSPPLLSSPFFETPETPPDSEDERDQPLAGVDCMWSSTSQGALSTVLSTSTGSTNNVQLKYKMNEETPAEKFSQFPFSLNDPLNFVHRPTSLKRPADSDGEEEVDVVSVDPQSRSQPCSPHAGAISNTASSSDEGCLSVCSPTNPVPLFASRSPSVPVAVRPPAAKRMRRQGSTVGRLQLSSAVDVDDNDESKRATHNVLERRRREDLKLLYTNLRYCLPDLVSNDRAAKVKILEHAFAHIRQQKETHSGHLQELAYQERRNVKLHDYLAAIRAKAAMA